MCSSGLVSDPVRAYDLLAPEFSRLSEHRRAYLTAIERLIVLHVPSGSNSLLDIGAGDGSRAQRIARSANIEHTVLLEPSAGMRELWPSDVRGWALQAEELGQKSGSFDIITCLWNVLGHIFPARGRVDVLRHCARLLSPGGRLFIDVNHRYNVAAYGVLPTFCRWLRDLVSPGETNGDVKLEWCVAGEKCRTAGHVFTHPEFRALAQSAGLVIEQFFTINYSTGAVRKSTHAGNPLFVLRRPNQLS
jgi:SAM-dependent methyltransferase